nr:transposase [Enterococcus phoeniculicola]
MFVVVTSVTKKGFPKAKVSIDCFYIIQQLTKALNKQRIRAMNNLKKSNSQKMKDCRKLKKYW